MMNRERLIALAAKSLARAPYKPGEWINAVQLLARATGSSHGQIAGWMAPNAVPLYLLTDEPDGLVRQWTEMGGADPARNPMVRCGMSADILEVVSDDEIISLEARKQHPIWRDLYDRFHLPHVCLTPLWRDESSHLVLAVRRSEREGVIKTEERIAFRVLAHMFQSATLVWKSLKSEEIKIAKGAFDAVSVAAIILDGFGRVAAMSAAAEKIVREQKFLCIRNGRLEGINEIFDQVDAAIRKCLIQKGATQIGVPSYASKGSSVTLGVAPFPREACEDVFGAAVIVLVEHEPNVSHKSLRSDLVVMLTPAEREVATALLQGARPYDIAKRRAVSVETVRSQIKNIYQKSGVSGYVEFVTQAGTSTTKLSRSAKEGASSSV
jgi:DNA-binding CsgD family transcriptional regulator